VVILEVSDGYFRGFGVILSGLGGVFWVLMAVLLGVLWGLDGCFRVDLGIYMGLGCFTYRLGCFIWWFWLYYMVFMLCVGFCCFVWTLCFCGFRCCGCVCWLVI